MKKQNLKSTDNSESSNSQRIPAFEKKATYDERYAAGKLLREKCPRVSHAIWKAPANRENVLSITRKSEEGRLEDLLPLRHGRMVQSPFTFYRAGAQIMASDLATTPNSGINLQICGDAHLSNFGGFATPERQVIFSINDLDETLPAPFEWDIKRLAASFVIGCRNNGLSDNVAQETAENCMRSYRENMADFSKMTQLDLWYYMLDSETVLSSLKNDEMRKRIIKRMDKARESQARQDVFPKLVAAEGEKFIIKEQLPTIFRLKGATPGIINENVKFAFEGYRQTLTPAHRLLLDRYELKDYAIKVVGVGSVGTLCWVLLLMADDKDPLFLQVKQAGASVLEPFAGKSVFENHGQRVVNGYRLMQPASDIFLGWTRGKLGRDFYFRQLRDMKIKPLVDIFGKTEMMIFAEWCGHALALAHARSGDAAMLCGYMGKSDTMEKAIGKFAVAYADQNEKDYTVFKKAVDSGKLKAVYDEEE
jgi:uncharacterized protein (DUF2252 family)